MSRSTLIPDEVLNPINPVNGYCVLVVRVKDFNNNPINGLRITCDAGGNSYTYNTNEKGATLFTINSLSANIFLNNYLNNGVRICDYSYAWKNNIEAPIGTVQNLNYQLSRLTRTTLYPNDDGRYIFRDANSVNINISGGGGGGGGGVYIYGMYIDQYANGGNGGNGYNKIVNNIRVSKDTSYGAYIGSGGRGGMTDKAQQDYAWILYDCRGGTGGTGGSTSFLGYSAAGGTGGTGAYGIEGEYDVYPGNNGTGGSGAYGGAGGVRYSNGGNGGNGWINIIFNYN